MLNLGLYLLRAVGAYKIYTEFAPWKFVRNHHAFYLTLYIDVYILLTSLLDSVIFVHCDLFRVYTIIGDSSPLLNPV